MFQDKIGRESSWSAEELGASKRYLFDLSISRSLTSSCQVVAEEKDKELGSRHHHLHQGPQLSEEEPNSE